MITDAAGNVCCDADFYPYGGERVVTGTCSQNYKFEGKERDTETGNDDFGARYRLAHSSLRKNGHTRMEPAAVGCRSQGSNPWRINIVVGARNKSPVVHIKLKDFMGGP